MFFFFVLFSLMFVWIYFEWVSKFDKLLFNFSTVETLCEGYKAKETESFLCSTKIASRARRAIRNTSGMRLQRDIYTFIDKKYTRMTKN